jgi:hypothetical protein
MDIEISKNLLPGLSIGARRLALKGFAEKTATESIITQIEAEYAEVVDPEKLDRARLICIGKIERYLSDREEAMLVSQLNTKAIEQSVMFAALEQKAVLCYQMVQSITDEMAALQNEPDPIKKTAWRAALLKQMGDLSVISGNTVRSQVMIAKFAIELPYRKEQLYGKKEAPRSEITPEFVLEMERMLGILPYDENFEPQPIEAENV